MKEVLVSSKDAALNRALEALGDPVLLNGVNNAKFFIKAALAQPADHSEQHLDMVKAQSAQQEVVE